MAKKEHVEARQKISTMDAKLKEYEANIVTWQINLLSKRFSRREKPSLEENARAKCDIVFIFVQGSKFHWIVSAV